MDLNGNGDLTEDGERFEGKPGELLYFLKERRIFELKNLEGAKRVSLETSTYDRDFEPKSPDQQRIKADLAESEPTTVFLSFYGSDPRDWRHVATAPGRTPAKAPLVVFDGTETMGLVEPMRPTTLIRGRDVKVQVSVGAPGVGRWSFARYSYHLIPSAARPIATVTFPPATPGGEPTIREIRFWEKC